MKSLLSLEIKRCTTGSAKQADEDCITKLVEYIKRSGVKQVSLDVFMRLVYEYWKVNGNEKDMAKIQAYCDKMSEVLEKKAITLEELCRK